MVSADTTRTTVSNACGVHHAAAGILLSEQEKYPCNWASDVRAMTCSTAETLWKDIKNQCTPCPSRWKQHIPLKRYHPPTRLHGATTRSQILNAPRTEHHNTISSTFLYNQREKEHEACLAVWKVSLTETLSLACLCSDIATLTTAQRNKRNR